MLGAIEKREGIDDADETRWRSVRGGVIARCCASEGARSSNTEPSQ